MQSRSIRSSIGVIRLFAHERGLREIRLQASSEPDQPCEDADEAAPEHDVLRDAFEQIEAFLAGRRKEFALPLDPSGTTFQLRVWEALRQIPYGRTVSYGELARRIGKPGAARAVGGACGHNPLPIVIPCHRVIAKDGGLGGFGSGIEIKRKLLALERGHRG